MKTFETPMTRARTIQLPGNCAELRGHGWERSRWVDCHERRITLLGDGRVLYRRSKYSPLHWDEPYHVLFEDESGNQLRIADFMYIMLLEDTAQYIPDWLDSRVTSGRRVPVAGIAMRAGADTAAEVAPSPA